MNLADEWEKEARRVVDAYWDNYVTGNVEDMIPLLHDDYTQVGSAEGEVFSNKKAATAFLYRTIDEVAGQVELRNRATSVEALGDLLFVTDLCDLYVLNMDEWVFYAKFRASSLLKEQDGDWRIVHQHSSFPDPRTDADGNLAIEQLAAENRQLERQVAERTADLEAAKQEVEATLADLKVTQAQLIQQEKMASLGQLTAGIAHEIKNPLNFVNNFAALSQEIVADLEHETEPDERLALLADLKQNAELINEHGKRADSIVRGMMQHASGATGRRELCAINQLVSENIDLAYHAKRAQVPNFNVEVERDFDADAGEVEIVPQEIARVLLNLLANAFDSVHEHASKAAGAYSPLVAISTVSTDGHVEIRVADNGSGIPEEVRQKIFEPFFTTKPTGSGTGLGLSLSYDIVTQGHAGSLTLDESVDVGVSFIVRLPRG